MVDMDKKREFDFSVVGARLRRAREKARLTQGQVAQYEGVAQNYISHLERGKNRPSVWRLLAGLACRYQTSTDYLLGLVDDPAPRRTEAPPQYVPELFAIVERMTLQRRRDLLLMARVLQEEDNARSTTVRDVAESIIHKLEQRGQASVIDPVLRDIANGVEPGRIDIDLLDSLSEFLEQ